MVFVWAAALYWQTRHHPFVNYDDPAYVKTNLEVKAGLSAESVRWAFTAFEAGNWHPLTWLSHMLDCELYGLDAGGHHLTNLLLHGANAALLLLVLVYLTRSLWPSLAVALLFAVHPLNVESVAWIAERKNVLSTLFWILAMGAWGWYAARPSIARYGLAALFLVLGLLAKPMVVTLPAVLLLLDWWPLRRFDPAAPDARRTAVRLMLEKLPLLALSIGSSVLTVMAQSAGGAVASLQALPFPMRLGNALVAYVRYLGKAAWPWPLAVFYPHPRLTLGILTVLAASALLVVITVLVLRQWRARPYLPVGWFWYLGTMVPVIGIVQVGDQSMADRYAYVTFIGIFLMVCFGLAELAASRPSLGRPLLAALAAVCLAFSAVTVKQVGYWKDSVTLFERDLAVVGDVSIAHMNIGLAYTEQDRWPEAIERFRKAVKLDPSYVEALSNLGAALAKQGDVEEGKVWLTRATKLQPGAAHARNNLGVMMLRTQNWDEAEKNFRAAVRTTPNYLEAWLNLGEALLAKKNDAEAAKAFAHAARLDPASPNPPFRLGTALLGQSRPADAAVQFRKALQIDPKRSDIRNSLCVALLRQGDAAAAHGECQQAAAGGADNADVLNNLALAQIRQKQPAEAEETLKRAVAANPRHAEAQATLGMLIAQRGDLKSALVHFQAAVAADPKSVVAQNNLGAALIQSGRIGEAIRHLKTAQELNPQHAQAHGNMGIALLLAGDLEGAIRECEIAVKLDPGDTNAKKYLAQAREQLAARKRR